MDSGSNIRDQLLSNLKDRVNEVAIIAADGAWAASKHRPGGGSSPRAAAAGGAAAAPPASGAVPLGEDEIAVTQLCAALEQCLLHGLFSSVIYGIRLRHAYA